MSGIVLSIDCDRIQTISRHLGVCLPMKITSLVCNQFRRARTDGLPIGEGLYGSSGITLSLPSAYQTSDGCNSPARFSFPQSYVEATVRNLTKGRRARSTWTRNSTLLAQRSGIFDRCKEFTRCATHLQNLHTMITIRSSAASSEPTLIGLEVILTTPHGTYMISSNGEGADFSSAFGGGLFSAISWPRSQFRLAPGIVLDQQLHSPGNYTLNRPYKRGSQSSRSFPVAVHARTATSVSTLTRKRTAGGLPGCQMCVDQRSSPIPMGGITMNQFGCSIAFASKRQPRLQRKT